MRIVVFGLSITSSWGNGHATVFRGLVKALSRTGAEVVFVEKDVLWYAENRDMPRTPYARVILYRDRDSLSAILSEELPRADVVMMGSYFPDGIPLADELARHTHLKRLYYDIDTPVTLAALAAHGTTDYIRADQLGTFDAILSFTGGPALEELEALWGARRAVALYCGLDPETHSRTEPVERYLCRLSYMGTYSADRLSAWERLFLHPSLRLPDYQFVLAGPQYPELELPANVRHHHHLPPSEHPAFYSSCDLTLNITREPMVRCGYSPSVRLFEAAGCAACVVSDWWEGLEQIFTPGEEVIVAASEDEMVSLLKRLGPDEAQAVGERAKRRALAEHTYEARARQLMDLLAGL